MKIEDYIYNLEQSLRSNYEYTRELYEGKEGALRLAREIGYGLADFTVEERNKTVGSLYGIFAVKWYNLKPTVDSKEFFSAMAEGLDKALGFRQGGLI